MTHEIVVTYDSQTVKSSVRQQWLDLIGFSGFAMLAVLAVLLVWLFASGDRSWIFGFGLAAFICWAGIVIFGYFRLLNFSMSKLRAMKDPTARFVFSDDGVSIASDTGNVEFRWQLVNKVIQSSEVWIIMVPGGGITLPTMSMGADLKAFLLDSVSRAKLI